MKINKFWSQLVDEEKVKPKELTRKEKEKEELVTKIIDIIYEAEWDFYINTADSNAHVEGYTLQEEKKIADKLIELIKYGVKNPSKRNSK